MPRLLAALLVACLMTWGLAPAALAAPAPAPGYLVIAPDRGFLGNEEVRDAFESYRQRFTAALAIVTEQETERFLKEGLADLERAKVATIVVVPLFVSEAHPLLGRAKRILQQQSKLPITFTGTMAGHYLISEILADRLSDLSRDPAKEALVLVATGATTAAEADAMAKNLTQIAHQVHDRFHFARQHTIAIGHHHQEALAKRSWQQLEQHLAAAKQQQLRPIVLAFDLTTKYDSMMVFTGRLQGLARKHGGVSSSADLLPHDNVALWLSAQSNAHYPVRADEVGVVFMPHGASHVWNRQMLDAIAPLQSRYLIEPAFSMADPVLIERAIRRLEARGARRIVVLRVFSLASSFQASTEYVLGLRPDLGHGGHDHGHGPMPTPAKIRSGAVLSTTGGVEASPLFADVLLDRAIALSKQPAKETVILMAHGVDDEAQNRHWLNNLAKLADRMRLTAKQRGVSFKGIQYLTWREDWEHLSKPEIVKARDLVQAASKNGHRAIVIPARTNGAGHEAEWLKGLSFAYDGLGFAPHPTFTAWVEDQITHAVGPVGEAKPAAAPAPAHHH